MALTRDFKETVRARVARDPKYPKALLREGVECMLSGDVATAKTILRDYINATVGFRACRGHAYPVEKPDAHAWTRRQSARRQSFRGGQLSSTTRGRAFSCDDCSALGNSRSISCRWVPQAVAGARHSSPDGASAIPATAAGSRRPAASSSFGKEYE